MNIRFLQHKEIDKKQWDHCIRNAVNGLVYAYSWYLDLVTEEWNALVEENYKSVFPLPVKKKWGYTYIMQPAFIQQLGLFSTGLVTKDKLQAFIDAIPGNYIYTSINLNTFNKTSGHDWKISRNNTYELDLIDPYETISDRYSRNCKRNLNKAVKSGINAMNSGKPEDIIRLFRENRGKGIRVLSEPDYKTLQRLVYVCLYKGIAEIRTAYTDENNLCAGIIFIKSKSRYILLFSGSDEAARKTGAMTFLIDRFIRTHSSQHLILDFEGSNDPDLARFYQGFGAMQCHYDTIERISLPFFLKPVFSLVRKLKR